MKEKISEFIKNKKSGKLLFIIGTVGIVLIYVSTLLPGSKEVSPVKKEEEFSLSEYKASLEESVKQIVYAVCLDANATVTVTLESGILYEYADEIKQSGAEDETKTSKESEQKYIIVKDSSGNETPLLITTRMPSVRGVAIICNAGEDESEKIKDAVTASFDISSRKVFIGRKSGNEKG